MREKFARVKYAESVSDLVINVSFHSHVSTFGTSRRRIRLTKIRHKREKEDLQWRRIARRDDLAGHFSPLPPFTSLSPPSRCRPGRRANRKIIPC